VDRVPTSPEPELEAAWNAVHEAVPARWSVSSPSYDPGQHAWSASAIAPHPGRGKLPTVVTGAGADPTAALRDLDDRLRGVPKPDGSRMEELRRRARMAYVAGAEEWARNELGRGLRVGELEAVLARHGRS
jgi:hypothetical protein